ncbi:helix-turn-helix domain-containing protein [Flavobacterium sp. GA093]|uniref:Helix-turn-helix domain-containing protein n=1 Tax=Flavobacterium hydrocarbonoxydans TaxID=2683249 RepID=A0A6I4NT93_9FLAO|nr:AraC family transcriptional regulator [Flavobacterium hydrocarbonoxydans]MWB94284.1 helix-turn-helix domain-containing protein [Flavobacterium hydrocarbonoxydans]
MKIKLKLVKHEKPIFLLKTGDLYNKKSHFVEKIVNIKKDKFDFIKCTNLISEGIVVANTQMYFSQPQTIKFKVTGESIILNFICCNNIEFDVNNVESDKITQENTHNILYTTNFNATFKIPSLEQINYISIILSPDFYAKLINEDWDLHHNFSNNIIKKKSGYLTPKYVSFSPGIQWVIHEIVNCQYEGAMKKMFLETKIKELLILQLESLIQKPQEQTSINQEDLKKLHEAKQILDTNFTNAPTLAELSRLISLNEFKLKKGFKACFKTTVKSYITKLRMEYAKDLIKNKTTNVSEVAYKCGYKDVSHFSAAFKIFYGFTPVSFRKIIMSPKLHLLYLEFFDLLPFFEFL